MNDDTTTQVTPSVSTTERRHTNNLFLEDICACPTCDTVAASVSEKLHFKDVNAPSYYDGDRSNGNKWHLKTEASFKRLFVPNFKDNLSAKLAAIDGTASATTANSESEDKSLEGSNLDMSQLPIRIRDTDTNEETLEENGCSEGGDGMGSERVGLPFRTACDEA
ncbi:uncharacterized protein I206_107013 [Kwoniella pini CBS 10737]|uniref:Uncharacterized protein n=1 Tax=Kwoniella pini CBS 10737 TaxID=1296096 RepID=A0A1B9HZH5_9TREE|nr:uncharacterized protein I206_05444 [Kwoniella pini CBS 10737]OCF48664.1 hypothetical protein I206_05444 [Kwoniella pini CBS 10737]